MQPNWDHATGVRAMLLRLKNIEAGQRQAALAFNSSSLPKDYLKSKYERKKTNDPRGSTTHAEQSGANGSGSGRVSE